jgi:cytochrome b6-f complex iron-sulfur subunit
MEMEQASNGADRQGILETGLSRRAWIRLSLAAAGALALAGLRRFLSYEEAPARPTRLTLDIAAAYGPNSVTAVPALNCWLVRDEAGFYAVSGVCSHLGCLVQAGEDGFNCPCHGSRFTREGLLVHGPALKPLTQVQVSRVADGRLVVDASVSVPLGTRLAF